MVRNIYPWNRPSKSRLGQEKGRKFELFWVLLCEMASFGVFVSPCVMRGGLVGSSPHSRAVVGPLRHERGFGGDPPPPHSRAIGWPPLHHEVKLG